MTSRPRTTTAAVALLVGGLALGGWAATAATAEPEAQVVAVDGCTSSTPGSDGQERSERAQRLSTVRMDQVAPGLGAVPQ